MKNCRGVLSFMENKMHSNYSIHDIGKNVWRIEENNTVNIYVVAGKKNAMVIDTGYGNIELFSILKRITDLPLLVFNTHGHPDHSGGNQEFQKIYANQSDFKLVRKYSRNDDYELESISGGDKFDLGDRIIEVIDTPGHTPGSVCLYDMTNKYLFTGDTCNRMTWIFLSVSTDFTTYNRSLEKLNEYLQEENFLVCPGHNEEGREDLLIDCVECSRKILGGNKGVPYEVRMGHGLNYTHNSVSIVYNPEKM